MSNLGFLAIVLCLVLELTFAADSPAPAPSLGADSSPQLGPTPETGSPDSAPATSPGNAASPSAPMAPSPSDLAHGKSSPASSPASSPDDASDINHGNSNAKGSEEKTGGDGGISGRKKAGIVVAVVAAACLVGFGGLVYKKRRDNIRRSQYGYAARREIHFEFLIETNLPTESFELFGQMVPARLGQSSSITLCLGLRHFYAWDWARPVDL